MAESKEGRLAGRLALVTGGGGAIGRAVCRAFAREGAKVVVADINSSAAKETLSVLQGDPTSHREYEVDVLSSEAVQEMFKVVCSEYKTAPSIVAPIAGGTPLGVGNILDMSEKSFSFTIDLNLKGTFLTMQAAARAMIDNKVNNGSIITIASRIAETPRAGWSSYIAAKAAVQQLTKVAALELTARGIRCNVVLPGPANTPFMDKYVGAQGSLQNHYTAAGGSGIPLGRFAEVDEIANVFTFLASDESSYVSGASIKVTGGLQ
ncbi:PREDICTED: estradiol 17-beta-dehydrogenase 8-like [Branchiostoma belcheri]|uniref:Estradiol 17-beta-dehydrogenase 8-like n=1 Tax=Branchiostoma belcheri TaxID=7741 RepID=A0A6P4ZW46_BRABE|nr:PREDICTED: estradiol 17-beta-dehydrogenase 8-like [Branchiostoma belcheri]